MNLPERIVIREGLALPRLGGPAARSPIQTDAVLALMAAGKWTFPAAGAKVAGPGDSTGTWEATGLLDWLLTYWISQ